MVLYDVKKNSGPSSWGPSGWKYNSWPVKIISINSEKRTAICSWNNNEPREWGENNLTKLRGKPWKEK